MKTGLDRGANMETMYSDKYKTFFRKDNFIGREKLFGECKEFALSYRSDMPDDVYNCVDTINSLDSSFPFELINKDYIDQFIDEYGHNELSSDYLNNVLDFFRRIYTPKSTREIVDTCNKMSFTFGVEGYNNLDSIDPRFLRLLDCYEEFDRCVDDNLFVNDQFAYFGLQYIAMSMAADAFMRGEDDFSFIKDVIPDLEKNFDIHDFANMMGLTKIVENTDDFKRIQENNNKKDFDVSELYTNLQEDIFAYIYEYLKENRYLGKTR